jgi:hypothetical protein
MFGFSTRLVRGGSVAVLVGAATLVGSPALGGVDAGVSRHGHGHRHGGCYPVYDAGTLCIDGCHYRIGSDDAYRQIARAFRREGQRAYLRYRFGEASVRVYGCAAWQWEPDLYDVHVHRARGYVEITLCSAGH